MEARGPPLPPIPSASSFNTDREMRGVRPGRTLEQKAQLELRRSSYADTSFRKRDTADEDAGDEEAAVEAIPEEPNAPKPGSIRSEPTTATQPSKPVILHSKTGFSTLLKNRHDHSVSSAPSSTDSLT